MRLIETCTCGASIEVIWSEPDGQYDSKGKRESKRSEDELEMFRTAHRKCPEQNQDDAPASRRDG